MAPPPPPPLFLGRRTQKSAVVRRKVCHAPRFPVRREGERERASLEGESLRARSPLRDQLVLYRKRKERDSMNSVLRTLRFKQAVYVGECCVNLMLSVLTGKNIFVELSISFHFSQQENVTEKAPFY